MEIYVDDMVIKSRCEGNLISDISETFHELRKSNMKLNPKKCTFGVETGQFLGYMITSEGITTTPKKIQAIIDMASPRTLREVQGLNGKLVALGRFLSKSTERSLPFFKTLKGCLHKNDFKWNEEAEKAFKEIKNHLQSLPTLTVPKPGETLTLYLAAVEEAISVVLLAERENVQKPVYFISKALQGPEVNYPSLEKLALALVHAARHLRRYFQAHTICVMTDQPIRQVLLKPKNSGRLAKWAIELEEHEIMYKPRTSIKGQIIADFLAECPRVDIRRTDTLVGTPNNETSTTNTQLLWTLFTDGASSVEGSGVGLILTDPNGQEVTYALRFNFSTSNNEAEYEALIAGLELSIRLDVHHLHVYCDSLLITNQVKGLYEAREDLMKKYLLKMQDLQKHFTSFSITQIPRSKNKRADALSKLASSSFAHLTKNVLVEIVPCRSIEAKVVISINESNTTWMDQITDYLTTGTLPDDPVEARKIRIKAPQYSLKNNILY